MGNLQSILGDCQLGQVPAYLQQYVASKGEGGDEAYMVYGDRLQFQRRTQGGTEDEDGLYYSGPSQRHVRANLIGKAEKSKAAAAASTERQVLADLVDLCVDGIDSPDIRERPVLGARAPGGQTFAMPRGERAVNTEVWDEAELKAQESGAVRATPNGTSRVKSDEKRAKGAKKKEGKSSKKSRRPKDSRERDADVDGRVDQIVESYPDDLKSLIRGETARAPAAGEGQEAVEEQTGYVSEVDEGVEDLPGQSAPLALELGAAAAALASAGPSSNEARSGPKAPRSEATRKDKTPPGSPARKDRDMTRVCREEEAKLLGRLLVVAHPEEASDEPADVWWLLEAEWYREWSAFVKGGPRPGRISNAKLINTAAGNEPWPNKLHGTHYVGLNTGGWNVLAKIYGYDIAVPRGAFDLYGPVVDAPET